MPTPNTQQKSSAAILAEIEAAGQRAHFNLLVGIRQAEANLAACSELIERPMLDAATRHWPDPARFPTWASYLALVGSDFTSALPVSVGPRDMFAVLVLNHIKTRPLYLAAVAAAGRFVEAYENALARETQEAEATRAALQSRLSDLNDQVEAEKVKLAEDGALRDLTQERDQVLAQLNAIPAVR